MNQDRQIIASLSLTSAIAILGLGVLMAWIGILSYPEVDAISHPELLFSHEINGEFNRNMPIEYVILSIVSTIFTIVFLAKIFVLFKNGFAHVVYDGKYLIFNDIKKKRISKSDILRVEFSRPPSSRKYPSPDIIEVHYVPRSSPGDTRIARIPSMLYRQSSDTIANNLRRVGIDVTPRMVTIRDD